MCHRSRTVELCEKMLGPVGLCEKKIHKMCHRSGQVELCEKMLEFIKCATGPDLWNYVKKCWTM